MNNNYTPVQLVKKIDDVMYGFSDYIYSTFSNEEMLDLSICGVFMDLVFYICDVYDNGNYKFQELFEWIEHVIIKDDELAEDAKQCFLGRLYNSVSNDMIKKSDIISDIGPLTLKYLIDYQLAYIEDKYHIL